MEPEPGTISFLAKAELAWIDDQGSSDIALTRAREHPARRDPASARYADPEARGGFEMPIMQEGPLRAARAHD